MQPSWFPYSQRCDWQSSTMIPARPVLSLASLFRQTLCSGVLSSWEHMTSWSPKTAILSTFFYWFVCFHGYWCQRYRCSRWSLRIFHGVLIKSVSFSWLYVSHSSFSWVLAASQQSLSGIFYFHFLQEKVNKQSLGTFVVLWVSSKLQHKIIAQCIYFYFYFFFWLPLSYLAFRLSDLY